MNVADSQRVASALESMGYAPTGDPAKADVIVLNTCMVRQSAEDKAYGRLSSLRPLKDTNPNLVINLMGCLVGVKPNPKLRKRFPYVDVFSAPSDPQPLMAYLAQRDGREQEQAETERRFSVMDEELLIPGSIQDRAVSAHLPIVLGCSHACTYCVIPYRRGVERSRPPETILAEARGLVKRGVKEITLLGQIVDRYGKEYPDGLDLSDLICQLNEIEGLERIRFLTSHPNWMNDRILDTVAALPKVCPHIEVPCQAGDDEVLANMKRGYTRDDYYRLVEKIRSRIPGVSIATDIIIGFPGETEEQFNHTYQLLDDLKLDVAHLARYSSRPDTVATRRMVDDVPAEEKMRRFRLLEDLQEKVVTEIHARLLGQTVEVLFEEKSKNRWRGRTRTNKLVFVESENDLRGQILPVKVTWTGPWSMQADILS
jgi:tRNA-2-methylthio-N6-dimethylallyladenosine synthase